jgi:catechol 2,3-dioxygenase-like lactoylglutathione lyase family enzyme
MIGVKKISHATYETPDLDQQIEYYTDVLGLTLTAREKDGAYLASTLDHHSVVLRKGDHSQCVRLGFQVGLNDDLSAFEKQTAAHGIKTQR